MPDGPVPIASVTLGAFVFRATGIRIGAVPRTIQTNTNCLAAEPIQTVAYTSGYAPIEITGVLEAYASAGETAAEHLTRLRSNLKTEVAKDSNTLTIDWPAADPEVYRIFRNLDFDVPLEWHVTGSFVVEFVLTLNGLPA